MARELDIIGKGLGEAAGIIADAECSFRVVQHDDQKHPVTADLSLDRVNLVLVDRKITSYTFG